MKITDSEKEIDIKSKKVEWGDLFKYLGTTTMKDRKLETEIQRIALMLAVLTVQNTTWKDKNNFSRSKRKKKKGTFWKYCVLKSMNSVKQVKLKQQQQNEEFKPLNSDVSAEFNRYHVQCTELTALLEGSRICSNWIP